MRTSLLLCGLAITLPFGFLCAQTPTDQNEGSRLEVDGVNQIYRFKWWGKSGRTYFIQHSDDLRTWNWVPVVEPGNDSIKEWGFTTTGDKFFARLQYWVGATSDPAGDDFDQDGVPNLYEVQHGQNPFAIEDSDADGLPDGWLDFHAGTFAIYPPTRLTASLSRNQTAAGNVYLNNDTDQAVTFAVAVSGNSGPSYSARDSRTGSAVYDWQDISATGTKLLTISDTWYGYESVPIVGFSFPFYGQSYSAVSVGVNGILTFGPLMYDESPSSIPYRSTYTPSNFIAPLWTNLETSTSGDIYYKQEGNRLIIQYQNVKQAYGNGTYTFQVILHADGKISLQYKTLTGLTHGYSVGIEDATQTLGLQLAYYSPFLANNVAVDILPSSEFFTIAQTSGTVAARSRTRLDGLFQSRQLPFGNYSANITLTHSGGGTSPRNVSANLTVKNDPSVVTLVYPTAETKILEGQVVRLSAIATDADSQVVKVELFDNGTKLGESPSTNANLDWTASTVGAHSLTAVATDVYGASASSASRTIQVLPDADRDSMDDAWEIANQLDPTRDDSMEDLDGDRIPNLFEYWRDTLPNVATSTPTEDFIVDKVGGAASPTDNIYSTINEAVYASHQSVWNPATGQWEYQTAWRVIQIKAGVYDEALYISGPPVLLLGELGAAQGPVEIRSTSDYTFQLYSLCALDGLVLSHSPTSDGAGIYSTSSGTGNPRRLLTNCIIKGNRGSYGGAIYNAGNSVLRIAHCTIFGNSATGLGRSIYNGYGATINIANSVIWGNAGTAPQEIYNETYAPGGVFNGGFTSIIKNGEQGGINVDPLLNPSGLLLATSPAINRTATTSAKASSVDVQGERRDLIGTPDLGADEYRDDNGLDDGDGLPDWAEFPGASSATSDADGDGISNLAEYLAGMNPRWNDSDRDGVTDTAEINTYNSNPLSSDSDLDGLADGAEVTAGTLLVVPDTDGDGISDGMEVQIGTNPLLGDSDLDGMPDGWELAQVFDYATLNPTVNDAGLDLDRDGLTNLVEFQLGTLAGTFDTDGDGLPDGFEHHSNHLDPLVINNSSLDPDGDGMSDLFEAIYGFNPDVADGAGDADGDGLSNSQEIAFGSSPTDADIDGDRLNDLQEQQNGTNPWLRDTDGDGLTDGWEVSVGLNPTVYNSPTIDSDQDGLTLFQEAKHGTSPSLADTDGDGTNDGTEVANNTDPLDPEWGGIPPAAPSLVVATLNSNGSTTYSWQDNSNNEAGFRIRQKQINGTWTLVGSVPANSTTYTTATP